MKKTKEEPVRSGPSAKWPLKVGSDLQPYWIILSQIYPTASCMKIFTNPVTVRMMHKTAKLHYLLPHSWRL